MARILTASSAPSPPIYGRPPNGRRRHIFPDQCQLCRLPIPNEAALLRFDPGWPPRGRLDALLCQSCDGWFTSLASDVRSARGLVARSIDGPYGELPHPALRSLSVVIAVADPATRELVANVCRRMGAIIVDVGAPSWPEALLTIVELPGDRSMPTPGALVLVPHHLRSLLPALASTGLGDWITLPPTPQQVAHALARSARPGLTIARDSRTALPVAASLDPGTPVLVASVAPSSDACSVAWLLKRFARGYDEVVVDLAGRIVVVPRCAPTQLSSVARRLTTLLDGAGTVNPAKAPARRSVDLAG